MLALNLGALHDITMQNSLCNLHWECVKFSIMIKAVYLPYVQNSEADSLSRWHLGERFQRCFKCLIENRDLKKCFVTTAHTVINSD